MSSNLDGATDVGAENSYPASPGEFAARWNAHTEGGRERMLQGIIDNADRGSRCWKMNHAAELEIVHAMLQHARDLHHPVTIPALPPVPGMHEGRPEQVMCFECGEEIDGAVRTWPCPTARALGVSL